MIFVINGRQKLQHFIEVSWEENFIKTFLFYINYFCSRVFYKLCKKETQFFKNNLYPPPSACCFIFGLIYRSILSRSENKNHRYVSNLVILGIQCARSFSRPKARCHQKLLYSGCMYQHISASRPCLIEEFSVIALNLSYS